jgi:hypothetical protein
MKEKLYCAKIFLNHLLCQLSVWYNTVIAYKSESVDGK